MAINKHHLFSVITGIIEGIFFTGVIWGWPSLVAILQQDGYFQNECFKDFNTSGNSINNGNADFNITLTLFYMGFCHDRTTGGGVKLTRGYYVGHNTTNVAQNTAKYVENNKKSSFWCLILDICLEKF